MHQPPVRGCVTPAAWLASGRCPSEPRTERSAVSGKAPRRSLGATYCAPLRAWFGKTPGDCTRKEPIMVQVSKPWTAPAVAAWAAQVAVALILAQTLVF